MEELQTVMAVQMMREVIYCMSVEVLHDFGHWELAGEKSHRLQTPGELTNRGR